MKVLFIGYVWPENRSSAAGVRTLSLIHAFEKQNWEIHFASHAKENQFSEALISQGIQTHTIQANHQSFDEWIKELAPEVVVFDRFVTEEQFGWRVYENSPQALRVLDTQDLHFLRRLRETHSIGWDHPDVLRELASLYRCHQTWLVSDFELKLLIETFGVPPSLLERVSLGYETPASSVPGFFDRENFVFIGNFRHPPNWDAVQWLARELWPKIRHQVPQAELHLYGAYPSQQAMALDSKQKGFRVFGPVEDQYEMFKKYRINLAPLRFGAGVKGKILDGWSQGVPCVATEIVAEGMMDDGGAADWGGCIGRNPEEWVDHGVRLFSNPDEWLRAQRSGQRILANRFSQSEVDRKVGQLCANVCQGWQPSHEVDQWVRKILWQEQFLAKKYMSKWIEQKNRDFTLASRAKSE